MRKAGAFAAALLPVVTVVALSGCGSSDGDDGATATAPGSRTASGPAPGATGKPSPSASGGGNHGRIDYTGTVTGGFDVTMAVNCGFEKGRFLAVILRPPSKPGSYAAPAFLAYASPQNTASLLTPDDKTFAGTDAHGLSAAKQGGTWTVTVAGMRLHSITSPGDLVTVNGHLTCTEVDDT